MRREREPSPPLLVLVLITVFASTWCYRPGADAAISAHPLPSGGGRGALTSRRGAAMPRRATRLQRRNCIIWIITALVERLTYDVAAAVFCARRPVTTAVRCPPPASATACQVAGHGRVTGPGQGHGKVTRQGRRERKVARLGCGLKNGRWSLPIPAGSRAASAGAHDAGNNLTACFACAALSAPTVNTAKT